MEKTSKRGKIPQQDWPSIIKRYEAGETLASIARTYDCSPPAISYILSRSRARDATAERAEESGAASSQPGPLNEHPHREAGTEPAFSGPNLASEDSESASDEGAESNAAGASHRADRHADEPAQTASSANGNQPSISGPPGSQPQSGGPRRTLHLSLLNNSVQRLESPRDDGRSSSAALQVGKLPQGLTVRQDDQNPAPHPSANNGGAVHSNREPHSKGNGSSFIDRALRERVNNDISAFLAAFDAALADDTIESRASLREATDRLLRAGARTRIELERLEARVPLSARDTAGHRTSHWPPR